MGVTKLESSVSDTLPVLIYGKESANSSASYPVIISSSGSLMVSMGLNIPEYDSLVISYSAGQISNIYFFIGGTTGTQTMSLALGYSSGNLVSLQNSIS